MSWKKPNWEKTNELEKNSVEHVQSMQAHDIKLFLLNSSL